MLVDAQLTKTSAEKVLQGKSQKETKKPLVHHLHYPMRTPITFLVWRFF